ncbi:serine threonine-protein kinase BRI1-like [Seminavis robusta]|uniref:Serine threonine-protein kinase BRI1-like n=1 Tax=Seminavis robusta TaxID=568900 RepID=A0A9N8HNN8_9STRA|nr:serine threonine-protein kinase BRI1-like [Seminavis robusta]|eukprot:Sro1101_g241380.1 serine threonine-protein kinase BRI1-like (679) ;mRNA; r:7581-9798
MKLTALLLLCLTPLVAGGACTGDGGTCETVFSSVTCTEVGGNEESCLHATGTCENVCERANVAGYDSPCLCTKEFQGCTGAECDYEVSCGGTIDCADFDNAVHCSVSKGCKWDPSADPTDTVEASIFTVDDYMTYLVNQGVSNEEDFLVSSSPQSMALQFIAVDDGLDLGVPNGDLDTTEGYEFITRYALAVLYYATLGPRQWSFELNFLQATPVCSWYSVLQYADSSTEVRGVVCSRNATSNPTALYLTNQNARGSLPAELGFITSLVVIDLDNNRIAGPIPESYQNLSNLTNFFAQGNRLNGTFPAWILGLPNIKNINFSTNYLTGTVPVTAGDSQSLVGLAIDNNLLTGSIQDTFDTSVRVGMTDLEQFYIENNLFTGALGPNFMKDLTTLQYLDISDNDFTGSVEAHLFELSQLLVLDMHDNGFDTLPTEFPENNNLTLLALQKCSFSSQPIPPSISNLGGLKHLDLSQNALTGEIPSSIGMTNLTYLFLAQNDFVANPIPSWIDDLTSLQELSLKSTQRTGTIPSFLGDLSDLVILDLDDNDLVGTIPHSLGNLGELHILLLNRNNLVSVIPDTFTSLSSLRLLYLDANELIQGDLDVLFCSNPDFEDKPVIVASCDVCDLASSECCAVCCQGTSECNTGFHVPDLDPIWQLGYNRVHFTFGREDFLDKDRVP